MSDLEDFEDAERSRSLGSDDDDSTYTGQVYDPLDNEDDVDRSLAVDVDEPVSIGTAAATTKPSHLTSYTSNSKNVQHLTSSLDTLRVSPVLAPRLQNQVQITSSQTARLEPSGKTHGDRLAVTNFKLRRKNLPLLCEELKMWLISNHCDFTFDSEKLQYNCAGYHRGSSVEFSLSVYRARDSQTSQPTYICEYRRVKGDCLHFDHVFQKSKNELSEEKAEVHGFDPLPLPDDFDERPAADEANLTRQESLASLVSIASSPYVKVLREGLRALALLSFGGNGLPRLITPRTLPQTTTSLLDALLAALSHIDEEVHRCAVTVLANLFEDDDSKLVTAKRFIERNGIYSVAALVSPSASLEVLRETSRCLCHVASLPTSILPASHAGVHEMQSAAASLLRNQDTGISARGKKLLDALNSR